MPTLIDQLLGATEQDTSEMDMDLEASAQGVQDSEDQMYMDMIPDAIFDPSTLKSYTDALNSASKLFDAPGDLEVSEDGMLTVPHMRTMLMIQSAASEAADLGELDPELVPEIPMDDTQMDIETGRIKSLERSRDFKRFLRAPPAPPVEDEVIVEDDTQLDMEL